MCTQCTKEDRSVLYSETSLAELCSHLGLGRTNGQKVNPSSRMHFYNLYIILNESKCLSGLFADSLCFYLIIPKSALPNAHTAIN